MDKRIGRDLVLDELFDLSLYKALRPRASGSLRRILEELIPVETKHHAFWENFFGLKIGRLDPARRLKLGVVKFLCRVFGEPAAYLVLEGIEIYGIRKYLTLWKIYENTPLAGAIREVLEDEFGHEDQIVSGIREKRINPERIRNVFLGFNDGLVEFVGAVGGFFAAFQDAGPVLVASLTGAAAGALSMAVGVFASSGSEAEMQRSAFEKERFLSGGPSRESAALADPFRSAVIVGVSYLFGAMVPILPVFLGAQSVLLSWLCGGAMLVFVTAAVSFISGMRVGRRVLTNLALVAVAVSVAYAVGLLVQRFP